MPGQLIIEPARRRLSCALAHRLPNVWRSLADAPQSGRTGVNGHTGVINPRSMKAFGRETRERPARCVAGDWSTRRRRSGRSSSAAVLVVALRGRGTHGHAASERTREPSKVNPAPSTQPACHRTKPEQAQSYDLSLDRVSPIPVDCKLVLSIYQFEN
jgi:hypothetical protein